MKIKYLPAALAAIGFLILAYGLEEKLIKNINAKPTQATTVN